MGLISALTVPGLALLLILETSLRRLQPDAFDPQKVIPEVDMKAPEFSESAWTTLVEIQVRSAALRLAADKQACVPWIYGMMLPVPIKPQEWGQHWGYWHDTYS